MDFFFFFFSLSCRCVCCRVGTCVHRELLLHAALSSVRFSAPIRVASPRVFMCTLRGTILNPTLRPTECPTDPVITTYILLWGSIREPFTKKITGDDEYLWGYTKGFSELPSPAQVQQRCKSSSSEKTLLLLLLVVVVVVVFVVVVDP